MRRSDEAPPSRSDGYFVALLILYVLGIGTYFVLRFGGHWMEVDTLRLTQSAQATASEATLMPGGRAYPYGFTYPVMTAWIAQLTGVSVLDLQTKVLPIAGIVAPALVALALFRAALGKGGMALLATLLLYLQADLLFVTLRGSHEKLTWSLAMLALFLLYRSAARPQGLNRFALHVALFYLTIYALIATNTFFASTLIAAITLGFLIGLAVNAWQARLRERATPGRLQRLALISASGMVLVYIFMFHLYAPARQMLNDLPRIVDRVATFLLGFEPQANPYSYIRIGWVSPRVYLALTLFTWLLLLGSLAEWIYQGYCLLRGARLRLPEALPWLLYAGFAAQIGVAIILDFAGVLSANLQLRILPGLVVFAVVLVAQALQRLLLSNDWRRLDRRLLSVGFALLVAWFFVAALLKASNDPAVSNKWGFYSLAEEAGLRWADTHLRYTHVWVGLDERLAVVHDVLDHNSESRNVYEIRDPEPTTRYFLLSEAERLRHARLGKALPSAIYEDRVYDNGETWLYRRWPRTPYQR